MLEMITAGGWVMIPILLCSVIALTIILERFIALRGNRIAPKKLLSEIWQLHKSNQLTNEAIQRIAKESPLGRVLAAGLINMHHDREVMKESIEEMGRQVVHDLERFLNALGTIAAISPLLGLLGTVLGMIKVFAVITEVGVGNPGVLAGGISEALVTTAAGLTVAIPALIFHRYFMRRIDDLVVKMEEQAVKLVEVIHGKREQTEEL